MSFQPVLPLSGLGGWNFLNRTLETQQASFARSPSIQRDTEYFRDRIGAINTAEELVSDRRLLRVALGAFGLEEDINNRAFLRKVLEDGTLDPKSLANRLADKRYLEFSRSFGFGENAIPLNQSEGFAERTITAFTNRQFEVAVGQQDDTMRLALGLRRDLSALAERGSSERAMWFSVMGSPPMRKVFEIAFSLPGSFGTLDLDQQLGILQERTRRRFGDSGVAQFRDPDRVEDLVQEFMLRAQSQGAPVMGTGSASVALQLLQFASAGGIGNSHRGSGGMAALGLLRM